MENLPAADFEFCTSEPSSRNVKARDAIYPKHCCYIEDFLECVLNWLYIAAGAGIVFVLAVGAALLALHELRQRGL